MSSLPLETPATAATRSKISGRVVTALSLGTFVEWFDFALYGFSSAVIAAAFFPQGNPTAALLATLAIYGVSFLARPLGGLVFGRIGDRLGRRTALSISLVLMGLATAAIGVIPPYAAIGVLAPALLVLARLVQGFAASSELVGAQTYVAESCEPSRRGLWVNVVGSFGSFGTAGATILVLLFGLNPEAYAGGLWRWPFVIGGIVALAGMYLRLRLEETEVFKEVKRQDTIPTSVRPRLRDHVKTMLVVGVFFVLVGIGFQTLLGYMPTYMQTIVGIQPVPALIISLFAFVLFAAARIVFGRLTDAYGRKPFLIGGAIAIVVLTIPAYLLIISGNFALVCIAQALLVMPIAAVQAAGDIGNLEQFPAAVRYTAVALSYTIAYAIFAGTAPLVDAFSLQAFGDLGPAYYGVLIALIAVPILIALYPETRQFSIRTGTATDNADKERR